MYKVIKYFTDMQDNCHPYNVGDNFPRTGVAVTPARLAELAGSDNRQGVPLIEEIKEAAPKKKKAVKKTAEK